MRRWLKKWLPDRDTLHREKSLNRFSLWFHHHPYLWHLNRETVARGLASGLLVAFIPMPIQMLCAATLSFLFRANLPIAIVTTWISNPITFVPINYLIYKTGALITQSNGIEQMPKIAELQFHWHGVSLIVNDLMTWVGSLGQTYIIGLIAVSLGSAAIGYCLARLMWEMYIQIKWRCRKRKK